MKYENRTKPPPPPEILLSLVPLSSDVMSSTKTWNDLKPPKTTYNHLQPSTTTSKISTTT
ncbi:hypothetical protein pdam_00021290 [Pocillopora damicornis]|uniref:Uncharacterized protein n=1 Tax=Pocillopora damicornis TaxID=46731 RepID=A0A3M6V639_POCDA|nr:hypothetical protein pdam_00021290 [Pocillopora damicornis]